MNPQRVLVAMSGGVDSSVAAGLLQRSGYDVTGVTMKLWGGEQDSGCCSVSDVEDARRVADQLGVPHHVFNFGDEFDRHVVDPYVQAHGAGSTPNPCIECNRHLKFDKLLRRAAALGFTMVATGHHARIVDHDGNRFVARGVDSAKDQSYVLHMLDLAQMDQTMFPVGDLTKSEVRTIARELGLRTADKPDSQDVCFIAHTSGGREKFLTDRLDLTPGVVANSAGEVLGQVSAVELVTVGQRRGLGVAGGGEPAYANNVDVENAVVTVGPRRDLLVDTTPLNDLIWIAGAHESLMVQTSAHGTPKRGRVVGGDLLWHEPQRKVAPGQSVVLYVDDRVVGSAIAAAG